MSLSFCLFEFREPCDNLYPFDFIPVGVCDSIKAAWPYKLKFCYIYIIFGFVAREFYPGCL
jgi:hypothetical protein